VPPAVGHVDVAAEEQDMGQDGEPRQQQREQPEGGPKPVHPTNQA
jgi:hypothetical protein